MKRHGPTRSECQRRERESDGGQVRSRSRSFAALRGLYGESHDQQRKKKDNGYSLRARQYSVSRLGGHATPPGTTKAASDGINLDMDF